MKEEMNTPNKSSSNLEDVSLYEVAKYKFGQLSHRSLVLAGLVFFIVMSVAGAVLAKHAENTGATEPNDANQSVASSPSDTAAAPATTPEHSGDPSIAKPSAAKYFAMNTSADASPSVNTQVLPTGTEIHVRLNHELSTDRYRSGDEFTAVVSEPVVVGNQTIVPQGATAVGRVIESKEGGHFKGAPRLQVGLAKLEYAGKSYTLDTSTTTRNGKGHAKNNWGWIGGGGAGGMLIGGLAGGGKGALIGGPIGAGAGTLAAFFTGKKNIHMEAETPLTFRLREPATMSLMKG